MALTACNGSATAEGEIDGVEIELLSAAYVTHPGWFAGDGRLRLVLSTAPDICTFMSDLSEAGDRPGALVDAWALPADGWVIEVEGHTDDEKSLAGLGFRGLETASAPNTFRAQLSHFTETPRASWWTSSSPPWTAIVEDYHSTEGELFIAKHAGETGALSGSIDMNAVEDLGLDDEGSVDITFRATWCDALRKAPPITPGAFEATFTDRGTWVSGGCATEPAETWPADDALWDLRDGMTNQDCTYAPAMATECLAAPMGCSCGADCAASRIALDVDEACHQVYSCLAATTPVPSY